MTNNTNINEKSTDRIDVAYKLFQERDEKGLCNLRGDIHTELQAANQYIYEYSLNAKAAEILEKSDEHSRLQKEISNMYEIKQKLEEIDESIVKLMNLLK